MGYCRDNQIELTRGRAYNKNDQAWIEQKNGAVIRRRVGYGRLEGAETAAALNKLYAAARLFVPAVLQIAFENSGRSESNQEIPAAGDTV